MTYIMEAFRFGACARPEDVAAVAGAGYDYIELNLNDVLALDEGAYRHMAAQMRACELYAEVLSGPLTPDVPILGPEVSAKRIHAALDRSFDLAQALGAEIVVFDCPHSRMLPRDFDPAMGWRQLGNFVRMLQSYASDFQLHVALLPLRRSVADLLNTTSEAALISAMLRLERVGVAASSYNMAMEAESLPQLKRTGSLLWHLRTSNVLGNLPPREGDGEDYQALFQALRDMGYAGRVSCEAPFEEASATGALKYLRAACQ